MNLYTKVILTIIALCLISINVHIWKPEKANAHWTDMGAISIENWQKSLRSIIMRDCFVDPERKHYPSGNSQITCSDFR